MEDGCSSTKGTEGAQGIIVGRHINGITLNPLEYLLDRDGGLIVFESEDFAECIRLGKMEICFMPDDNDVKVKINFDERKYHHVAGKKTKGNGGS